MSNIALIAESPNDAISIRNLLLKKYPRMRFTHIAKNRRGSQQDSDKLKKEIKAEVSGGVYNYYIFIRDLDGLETQKDKVKGKETWFKELNKIAKGKGIFLLNIYELEALILSDINNFNKFFGTQIKFKGDPMKLVDPKKHLIEKTFSHRRKYKESDCPEIFAQLDIKTLTKNCRYFKQFINDFDAKIKSAA